VTAADAHLVPVALEEPVIVRGAGCLVEDVAGRQYLDLVGGPGVVATGHCHPAVVAAVAEQAATLSQSPGKFYTAPLLQLAERLAGLTPPGLDHFFFCNSGAEANEGALKLAKKVAFLAGRGSGIIAFERSFHGRTTHALAVTGGIKYKRGLDAFLCVPGVVHVPYPDPLRHAGADECTQSVLAAIEDAIFLRAQGEPCAVIVEAIAAVGGVIVPPDDFLPGLRALCDRHRILLIVDEVYTGLGRTGTMFACEHTGVRPDLLTMAKALGGGLPLGGFATTAALAEAFAERREHFTTFGLNSAISCAAGLAALDVMASEHLVERARLAGLDLLEALRTRVGEHPNVAEVRGRGLLVGIELADPGPALTPRPDLASAVRMHALDEGVLVSVCGPNDSVLRLSPPLTIEDAQLERAVDVLGRGIDAIGPGR
jgi:4-aminobutyrate aminotransferase-like enzyme